MAELNDLRRVRLLTADLNTASPLIDDDTLQGFLDLNDGSVYLAAADALDAMATSETLLGKKVRTASGVSTDGPAVAADLRAKAAALRERAAVEADALFEFVPFAPVAGPEGAEL